MKDKPRKKKHQKEQDTWRKRRAHKNKPPEEILGPETQERAIGGWWLVVVGWWLVVGGWWRLVVGGWWLESTKSAPATQMPPQSGGDPDTPERLAEHQVPCLPRKSQSGGDPGRQGVHPTPGRAEKGAWNQNCGAARRCECSRFWSPLRRPSPSFEGFRCSYHSHFLAMVF